MPLPDWVFFLDENHQGTQPILQALRNAGCTIELHSNHFGRGTADDDWLPLVGARGWVLLTSDKRIRYYASKLAQVVESRLRLFCFSSNNLSGKDLGETLRQALPTILRALETHAPPYFATIEKNGRVTVRTLDE